MRPERGLQSNWKVFSIDDIIVWTNSTKSIRFSNKKPPFSSLRDEGNDRLSGVGITTGQHRHRHRHREGSVENGLANRDSRLINQLYHLTNETKKRLTQHLL